jgi:hypothetical protein
MIASKILCHYSLWTDQSFRLVYSLLGLLKNSLVLSTSTTRKYILNGHLSELPPFALKYINRPVDLVGHT